MPVVAAVAGVVGAVASIGGGIAQASANKKASKANVSMHKQNAMEYLEQAERGNKIMGYQLGQFDTNAGRYMGQGEAAVAASGVELSGSAYESKRESITNLSADRYYLWEDYDNKIKTLKKKAVQSEEAAKTQAEIGSVQLAGDIFGTVAAAGQGVATVGVAGTNAGWW
jgi:hypothetical protein